METKRGESKRRWMQGSLTIAGAAALGAVIAVGMPESASAGDDFERGFKRELGAIAAHEAVGIGRHILGGVITGGYGHHGYAGRHHYRSHYRPYRPYPRYRPYRSSYRYFRPLYRSGRPSVRHEHHHYYHGDSCEY